MQPRQFLNLWCSIIEITALGCSVGGSLGHAWYIFVDDSNPQNPVELTFGLWENCRITLQDSGNETNEICLSYQVRESWLTLVQYLTISSCILIVVAFLLTTVVFKVAKIAKWSIATKLIAGMYDLFTIGYVYRL